MTEFVKCDPVNDFRGYDPVEHPSHYTYSNIECIDAIRESMTYKEWLGYLKGNCLKYLWRYSEKGGSQDLRKAQVYLNWLTESVEAMEKEAVDVNTSEN